MADSREIKLIINGQAAEGSLNVLYKKASELKKVLNQLDPNDERVAEFNKELSETQTRIDNARGAMGMLKTTTSSFGDTLANIGKAAFWMAILQFVYEWAKAFVGVTQEVAKTRKEISLLTDATGKDLDDLTTRVTAIGKTFGADYMEVIKSANAVAKQFGITQKEAFDLIEKGFEQNGTAFTDKLTDLQEYPIQFKNAGISAESYFKIVSQEIKGGIFDNKLQDTIKEIGLSLSEFTKTQQDALTAAFGGEFTQNLLTEIDTGAITTEQAFVKIMKQSEKVGVSVTQMQTITADVFKGAGEDVGGAAYAWENYKKAIDTTGESTNEYAKGNKAALDSAKVLASAQNELASVLEKQNGNFQKFANEGLALAARILTVMIEKVFSTGELMYEAAKSVGELLKSFGLLNENTDLGASLLSVLSFALDALYIPFRLIIAIVKGVADMFTFLSNSVQTYVNSSPNLIKVFTTIGEYLGKIGWAIGQVVAGFDELFRKVGMLPEKKVINVETKTTETDSTGTKIKTKTDAGVLTDAEKAAQKARETAAQKAKDEATKLAEQQQKDEIKANEIREALRIKNIADETERQKAELEAKALKDAQEVNLLKINELDKADLRKQIAENLKNDLQAIDRKAFDENLAATIEGNKIIDDLEKLRVDKLNADKLSQANADVINAEIGGDPQAIFDAKIAQLATEREIELANLELSEAAKNEIIARYAQEEKAIKQSKVDAEIATMNQMNDLGEQTLTDMADIFGKQSALGKQALMAAKVLNTSQVVMNSIVEISSIWKDSANIPIVGQVIGALRTAAAVARAAAAVAQLGSTKFADGGLLQGNSHANGGIKGTGRFGNFEAEGGEFFVNRQATANNLSALSMLNTYGRNMSFDLVPRIKFAMGGQLPNNIPSQALGNSFANQNIAQTNDMFMIFNEQISGLRSDINNFETNKKTYIVYTELETVANDVTQIRSYGG